MVASPTDDAQTWQDRRSKSTASCTPNGEISPVAGELKMSEINGI
jgi:hypothetical protein